MRFLHLKVDNLFALRKSELDLRNRGLLLITGYSHDENGANGAGKSSLANKSILWTLYGKTAGGIQANSVVNKFGNKKSAFGEITLESNGVVYVITRQRPSSLKLFDKTNDKDISLKNAKDTQLLIDKIIGMDYQTFLYACFFGQGRKTTYPDLPTSIQKKILSDILPIQDLEDLISYTEDKTKLVKDLLEESERVNRDLDVQINSCRSNKNDLLYSFNKRESDVKKELEELESQLENESKRLEKFNESVAETQDALEKNKIKISSYDVDNLKSEQEELLTQSRENSVKNVEAARAVASWDSRYRTLNKSLDHSTAVIENKSCPVCFTEITNVDQRVLENKEDLINSLKEADKNLEQSKKASEFYKELDVEFSKKLSVVEDNLRQYREIQESILNLTTQMNNFANSTSDRSPFLKEKIKELRESSNPFKENLELISSQLENLEKDKSDQSKVYNLYKNEYEGLVQWKSTFKTSIRLSLFEQACIFLEERTSHHLNELGNSQIRVKFKTNKALASGDSKEELDLEIFSETGGDSFSMLSGGEQQMVSFAIGLAFADLATSQSGTNLPFMILDEPFTELDAKNSQNIVNYLTGTYAKCKETILLISNEDNLKGLVPNNVQVFKKNGISEIVDAG